ncbi:MAG: fibronectin type III domain-containing protein [Lachnospiraceae bacterium]|nr:fibronectin type III domain-containing protein [Lachnospiraceae bacterium]
MTVFVVLVPDRFAYAFGDTTEIVKVRGQNCDLSDIPPDEGGEITGTDELTIQEKERILNGAELNPMTTGYAPLDSVVQEIFSENLTNDMSTYEKVCAIYAYLMKDRVYDGDMPYVDWLYYNIHNVINYRSDYDRNRVCEAYGFLTREPEHITNKGICQHYNSAFVIMTRAIGLDTYVVDCTSTSGTAISSHECSVFRDNGTYYLFDPVMGVFLGNSEVETSVYFCAPLQYHSLREYCDMNEMINSFGCFETITGGEPETVEEIPGATVGEFHFMFGSYPQTQVVDSEMIAALNGLLDVNNMRSYGYSSGDGTIGSQTQSDYMRYADVEYEGVKYRAVRFSTYRPTYSYMPSEEVRSYQDNYGFSVNETYWFRFDPIEWRLVDGDLDNGTLLLADLALDAQPFNYAIYASETAKIIDGKEYYVFKDAAFTKPINDWSTSDIRAWLNDDFLNTAFSDEEKALIANSTLHNYGVHGYYDCADTIDQVFLLSRNEAENAAYFLGASNDARVLQGTDYARCQGLGVDTASQNSPCTWILRSAGDHSSDIIFVNAKGKLRFHMKAASEMCGIRPALRVSDLSALIPDAPVAPSNLTANATGTGEITVSVAACNGASSYRFYIYAGDEGEPMVISSVNPTIVVKDMTPGQTYRVCATAIMLIGGQENEGPATEFTSVLCRAYLDPPENMQAVASATRTITLSWTPVNGAVLYRVYRYVDSETLVLCGETLDTTLSVEDLGIGYVYYFKVSCVSVDGRESNLSSSVSCQSESIPPSPQNLTFATVSNGTVRISWDASQGADRYHVERYIGDGYTEIGVTTNTEYSVAGLTGGVTYYFRVIAENEDRTSCSNPVYGNTLCRKIFAPDNIAVQLTGDRQLTVSWNASDGATKYEVYRYPDPENAYAYIGSTSILSYDDSDGLTIGKTYYYRVVAVDEGTGYRLESGRSEYASAKVYGSPDVPVGVAAVSTAANTVTISWTKVTNAISYNVYRYRGTDKTYIYIGNTTGTSYDATGLSAGTTYYFKVAAVAEGGGMTFTGSKSASVNATVISNPVQVTGLKVEATGDRKLTLSWNASAGATEYDVYRYQGSTNTYVYKATTSNRSYVDSDSLAVGTTYYYRVVAVNKSANYRLEAPRSASASAKVLGAPAVPAGVTAVSNAANTVTISWTKVKNATSYNVYRYRGTDKTYIYLGSTTGVSYDATGLSAGTTYYFKVAAVVEGGGKTFIGSKSASVSAKVIGNPAQVTGLTVEATGNRQLTLRWSASAGATEYDVYRYQGSTNTYVYKATTSNRSYIDSDSLSVGTTYYYRVVAVNKGANYRLEAPRSTSASAKVLGTPAVPTGVTAVSNSQNTAMVKWSAVKTATKYNVYRYRGSDKTYIYLGSTTGTSYTVIGLTSGTTYYFKVEAVAEEGGMTFTGSKSASVNTTVR